MRAALLVCAAFLFAQAVHEMEPLVTTEAAPFDVDDPAIWYDAASPESSLIVGTIKRPAPAGGLAVYSLSGKIVETVSGLDRPNNADIVGSLCVVAERLAHRLVFYRVRAAAPYLERIGELPVFEGSSGDDAAPMGVALYERPRDRALFAIVSRKTGPARDYLAQYRIHVDGRTVKGALVRRFGAFSGTGEIEAVAVDARTGLVYYSDEDCCVRAYAADPDARGAGREVRRIGLAGFRGNREGIAIAGRHVIVTDQIVGRSEYHLFDRDTGAEVRVVRGRADSTDGIEALDRPLGPRFPQGVFVAMHSAGRAFQLYDRRTLTGE